MFNMARKLTLQQYYLNSYCFLGVLVAISMAAITIL